MNERWPFIGKKKYNGSKERFRLRDRTETRNIFNKRNLYVDVLDSGRRGQRWTSNIICAEQTSSLSRSQEKGIVGSLRLACHVFISNYSN